MEQLDAHAVGDHLLYQPRGEPRGRVVEAGSYTLGLVATYLGGEVSEHVTADGGDVVQQRHEFVPRHPSDSGDPDRLPCRGVPARVEDGDLVDGARRTEVAQPQTVTVRAVVDGAECAVLDNQQRQGWLAPHRRGRERGRRTGSRAARVGACRPRRRAGSAPMPEQSLTSRPVSRDTSRAHAWL